MPQGLIVFLRATFAFFALLLLTRVMGKRQLSQLTFFDYVNGISIGSMAATLAVDLTAESIPTLVGLLTWSLWVMVLAVLSIKSRLLRRLIDGKPTIAIQNGKILEDNLHKYGFNIDDMRMLLRQKDVFNLSEVEYLLLEADGQISVLKKSQNQPLTPFDLNIPTNYKGLAVDLISGGKILTDNLDLLDLSEDWLLNTLAKQNLSLEDVFYAELETSGNLYLDVYQDPHSRMELTNG